MNAIVPQNNYILCKMAQNTNQERSEFGFVYNAECLPIYEILALPKQPLEKFKDLKVGDLIICNSTGTQIAASDTEMEYLFNIDNVAAKLNS